MVFETAILLREMLADNDTLYVHLDWHVGHYVKAVLDEIFSSDCFINEVIWHYKRWPAPSTNFQKMPDVILVYGKSSTNRTFNVLLQELTGASTALYQGAMKREKLLKMIFAQRI